MFSWTSVNTARLVHVLSLTFSSEGGEKEVAKLVIQVRAKRDDLTPTGRIRHCVVTPL